MSQEFNSVTLLVEQKNRMLFFETVQLLDILKYFTHKYLLNYKLSKERKKERKRNKEKKK